MSMQDDLMMMQTEAVRQDQYAQSIERKAANIDRRESRTAFDFDRALIFVRSIHVRVSIMNSSTI